MTSAFTTDLSVSRPERATIISALAQTFRIRAGQSTFEATADEAIVKHLRVGDVVGLAWREGKPYITAQLGREALTVHRRGVDSIAPMAPGTPTWDPLRGLVWRAPADPQHDLAAYEITAQSANGTTPLPYPHTIGAVAQHWPLTPGKHHWRVRAFDTRRNVSGWSAWSALLGDTEAPPAVTVLRTSAIPDGAQLDWSDYFPPSDLGRYEIILGANADPALGLRYSAGTNTSYTVPLTWPKILYAMVYAYDQSDNQSPAGNWVTVQALNPNLGIPANGLLRLGTLGLDGFLGPASGTPTGWTLTEEAAADTIIWRELTNIPAGNWPELTHTLELTSIGVGLVGTLAWGILGDPIYQPYAVEALSSYVMYFDDLPTSSWYHSKNSPNETADWQLTWRFYLHSATDQPGILVKTQVQAMPAVDLMTPTWRANKTAPLIFSTEEIATYGSYCSFDVQCEQVASAGGSIYNISAFRWAAASYVASNASLGEVLVPDGNGNLVVAPALYVGRREGIHVGLFKYYDDAGSPSYLVQAVDKDNRPFFSVGSTEKSDSTPVWGQLGYSNYPRIEFRDVPGYPVQLPTVDVELIDNLNAILLYPASGALQSRYAATAPGLTAGLAAAGSGDIVRLPAVTLGGDYTLPAGVTLRGLGRYVSILTGQITGGAGSNLETLSILRTANDASKLCGVVGPASGSLTITDCSIVATQTGAGTGYAISVSTGDVYAANSRLVGSTAMTDEV